MSENNAGAENVRWDLGIMYAGLDDPQIDADIAEMVRKAKDFNAKYKGKLATNLGPATSDYSEMAMLQNKLTYLFLLRSTDLGNAAVKAKTDRAERILSKAEGDHLTFFDLELAALSDDALARLYAEDEVVRRHKPWILHKRIFKPHLLSEPVESALTIRAPYRERAWHELYSELSSDLRFDFRGEKKTLTEVLHILTESKDAVERAELLALINSGLGGLFAKYSAQTLNVIAGAGSVEDWERNYRHPMEQRNKLNRVSDEMVGALHKAMMDVGGPLARRFYRLKAAHLGLPKLKWSDRNAPMPFADKTIVPFDEGMATVIAAYENFSPTLASLIRDFVRERRIDVPPAKGKRGGAFNSSLVLPGNIPASFILLNYFDSNQDVMTLAHELGHAVHGMLAGKAQGVLMSDTPIAYAETASVFGEMVTFNFLKQRLIEKGDNASLLALIMGKIDDVVNTTVRQIGFSNFERRLHGMDASYDGWHEPEKLSVEQLSSIWLETTKQLYGADGEVFTYENSDLLWSYVPHFHEPFYVYGYAFGQGLVYGLYAKQADFGDRFGPLYLDLLRAGSTKDAVELLTPFGLDPRKEDFWADGLKIGLGTMIDEAERLSRDMGVVIS